MPTAKLTVFSPHGVKGFEDHQSTMDWLQSLTATKFRMHPSRFDIYEAGHRITVADVASRLGLKAEKMDPEVVRRVHEAFSTHLPSEIITDAEFFPWGCASMFGRGLEPVIEVTVLVRSVEVYSKDEMPTKVYSRQMRSWIGDLGRWNILKTSFVDDERVYIKGGHFWRAHTLFIGKKESI